MFKVIENPNGTRQLVKESVVSKTGEYKQLYCIPQPKQKLLCKNTHKQIGDKEYLPDNELLKWLKQNEERIRWI
ncbi:MAG: hypothetical protein KatS3mg087_1532 [Patescibacteria group bacterium]|nr:MAG: hypothetical protein KatS3mg087_1532 [Patescibacteria group bacterium]